jgi:hypothetical protein
MNTSEELNKEKQQLQEKIKKLEKFVSKSDFEQELINEQLHYMRCLFQVLSSRFNLKKY